jgi:hypothetical protein
MEGLDTIAATFIAIEGFDKRRRQYRKIGWIYAARNESNRDPVFKIGQSSRRPYLRIAELSSSTSVYRSFELVYFVHVADRDIAERHAHSVLQESRVAPGKEFFEAPLPAVVQAMDRAAAISPVPVSPSLRAGYLAQPLEPWITICEECGSENRVPHVLIPIHIKCGLCGRELILPPPEPKSIW